MAANSDAEMAMRSRPAAPAAGSEKVDVTARTAAKKTLTPDLCVIGAGSGGLSVAAAAAALGVSVVLIEKHKMGGDCLNSGCVPSKALLAAAHRAQVFRASADFGINAAEPVVDFKRIQRHVRSVIDAIAPNDSVERFTALGVQVIQAAGRFIDKRTVEAGDIQIRARRFVVATGSSPSVPPIPGLDGVPYFTNETIFNVAHAIGHLIIIGGGPIGLELAQAHRRLGAKVTVLEGLKALGKDDPELTAVALKALREEGIDIREDTKVERILMRGETIEVATSGGQARETVSGTHLLVATGRKPNIEGLGLAAAGIKADRGWIGVSDGLVTSNSRVFAIGDVVGGLQFTHVANYHASVVIKRALFRVPARVNKDQVPWVTFTDPEIANAGLTEPAARERKLKVNVYRWPYHENDRAQAERTTRGLVKVITSSSGKILGAGIVGAHAGELIQIWSLAVSQGLKIGAMTRWVSPYPTLGEISKRAAFTSIAGAARSPAVRKLLSFLRKFG